MPRIIDYPLALKTLESSGLKCVYYNSGAFGFPTGTTAHITGWMGPEDSTIKPEARRLARMVSEPYGQSLSNLLRDAWRQHLPGTLWLMPASHWAYELEFGSSDWMPDLIRGIGIDPALLRTRSDASPIEFQLDESDALVRVVETLLTRLISSDFTAAFPQHGTVAMLHHHQQIWWQTANADLCRAIAEPAR